MTRMALEHIIRASGSIADVDDIIVVGSQAILGQFPDAPAELLVSNEADVYPRDSPDRSDLIDATLGEGSPFQKSFGYYAHGIDETTAILPAGWRDRLILISGANTRFVRGWCLEVHDLAIAKYAAGREKDFEYTKLLAQHGMVRQPVLEERLHSTLIDPERRTLMRGRIRRDFSGPPS